MSNIIKTEKKSVLPYYGGAAASLVLAVLLPGYTLGGLAAIVVGGAAVCLVLKRVCAPVVTETEVSIHTGVGDVDEMLESMQQQLDKLHILNDRLPDPTLTAAMDRMEKAGRGIMEAIEKDPQKAKLARRFSNYYLPDAVAVLEKYAELAKQGVKGENAASIKADVENASQNIATAFENQLDSLYEAESMDLSADLEVLQNLMKGQGLN